MKPNHGSQHRGGHEVQMLETNLMVFTKLFVGVPCTMNIIKTNTARHVCALHA